MKNTILNKKIKDKAAKKLGMVGFHEFDDDYRPDEITLKLIDEIIKQTKKEYLKLWEKKQKNTEKE